MSKGEHLKTLNKIRKLHPGIPGTCGLDDNRVTAFLEKDPKLGEAIEAAYENLLSLQEEFADFFTLDPKLLLESLQQDFLNFYAPETLSPYIPLAARGPWIIGLGGAVIYDTGGYGMLGLGHDPKEVREILGKPLTMANIMTPSFTQWRFAKVMKEHIGFNRSDKQCPYEKFVCINSGSEACAVAARISSAQAKRLTDPGQKYEGREIKLLSLKGSFHGRTLRPAQASDSSRKYYQELALFRDKHVLETVEPNNLEQLQEAFDQAEKNNIFFEAFFMEPVMGEGNPGMAIRPEFYSLARKLTKEHHCHLIIDSIQAGLRAQGVLSIVDYPGFEDCEAPDMETFSKALNAGQFPLSTLALRKEVAKNYVIGTYGNTMTTNPRALEVACKVLSYFDKELRKNIRERGREFVSKLEKLKSEMPEDLVKIQGTGLLVSAELSDSLPVVGYHGVEMRMRQMGVNVIHGGKNCLRYTPHFFLNSEEIDLIVDMTRESILHVKKNPSA